MTTIEKIKAEIERLKGQLIRGACAAQIEMETNCKERAYDEVISFLSTLESEKPIIPDGLDEEVHRFFEECIEVHEVPLYGKVKEEVITADCYEITARHFAQWGAEHLADARKMIEPEKKEGRTDCSPQGEVPNDSLATQSYEKIPNDLEEAAKVYFENPKNSWQVKDVFIAGAKWDRQQMLKEAVEGTVMDFSSNQPRPQVDVLLDPHKYHTGDKVRIIVIPNTDEK